MNFYYRRSDKADNILEEKVNKHFEIVRWKMFKKMINGNKESYCECYVDGIAYHDGLKKAIEQVLKIKVIDLPVDPQLMGALGAAEYARQKGLAQA